MYTSHIKNWHLATARLETNTAQWIVPATASIVSISDASMLSLKYHVKLIDLAHVDHPVDMHAQVLASGCIISWFIDIYFGSLNSVWDCMDSFFARSKPWKKRPLDNINRAQSHANTVEALFCCFNLPHSHTGHEQSNSLCSGPNASPCPVMGARNLAIDQSLTAAQTTAWRKPTASRKRDTVAVSKVSDIESEEWESSCVLCHEPDFSEDQFGDRTVIICDQCEKEYHVGCLRKKGMDNLSVSDFCVTFLRSYVLIKLWVGQPILLMTIILQLIRNNSFQDFHIHMTLRLP